MERRKGEFSKREEKKESPNFMNLQKDRERKHLCCCRYFQARCCVLLEYHQHQYSRVLKQQQEQEHEKRKKKMETKLQNTNCVLRL